MAVATTDKLSWLKIPGWLTPEEGELLQKLAKGRRVLELGSYHGRSTVAMAQVARSVTSVDWHHGDAEIPDSDTLPDLRANLDRFGVAGNVEVIDDRIENATAGLMKRRWDMVHIDSSHDASAVERDTRLALSVLFPGGCIVWHDWDYESVREGAYAAGLIEGMIEEFGRCGVLMARKWQVALTFPHYGQAQIGTLKRTLLETQGTIADVVPIPDCGSSALPHGFNRLLALSLGWRDKGIVTHQLVCHSDVVPGPGFFNTFTEEMARLNTVALSSVIPIKEPELNPRTSTAIGDIADPWTPKRYIHVGDYGTMPDTFCGADVCGEGEELLINTGLMLLDLRSPFWDDADFAFQFHTRIHRTVGEDGQITRTPQFRPEDWEMSRELRKAGLPYHATWKVHVKHHGDYAWENRPR